MTRDEVLRRFRHDDEASVRGVLRDLTESSLVFASGSGRSAAYRAATPEEIRSVRRTSDRAGLEALVWSVVYREPGLTQEDVAHRTGLARSEVASLLDQLGRSGRVEGFLPPDSDESAQRYRSRELVLGLDDTLGWEASVLDHFSTMVQTIAQKLSKDQRATLADEVGGSTYHLELWRGHPHEDEVLGELGRFRERMSALRARLDEYNAGHRAGTPSLKVHAYYGQWVLEEDQHEESGDEEA